MKTRKNRGFSTTELVIVVLILAIIAVLLTPQVIKWIRSSRQNSDVQLMDSSEAYANLALGDDDAREESTQGIKIHIDESGMTISGNNGQDIEDFANKYAEVAGIDPGDLVPAGDTKSEYKAENVKPKDKDTVIDINISGGQVAASSNIDNDDIDNTHETEVADNNGGGSLPGGNGGNGGGNTPGGNGGNGGGNTPGGNGEGGNTPGGNGEGGNGEGGNEQEAASFAISLDKSSIVMRKGAQAALAVTIENPTAEDQITWKSESSSLVSIDYTGVDCVLTSNDNRTGDTTVSVTVTRGSESVTASCDVTVSGGTVITLDKTNETVNLGDSITITADIFDPNDGAKKSWRRDSAAVAISGSSNGSSATFVAKQTGKATVTFTYTWTTSASIGGTKSHELSVSCEVTVVDPDAENRIDVVHYVDGDYWRSESVALDATTKTGKATDESIYYANIELKNDTLNVSKSDKEVYWNYKIGDDRKPLTLNDGAAIMPKGNNKGKKGNGAYNYNGCDVCKNLNTGENALFTYSESYDGEHAYAVIERSGRVWTLSEYEDVGRGSSNTQWKFVQTFKIIVGKDFATER